MWFRVSKGRLGLLLGVPVAALLLFGLTKILIVNAPEIPPQISKPSIASFPLSDLNDAILTETMQAFWEKIHPAFKCPPHLYKRTWKLNATSDYAVCGRHSQLPHCVVYSFGVDQDSAFEADLLNTTNCTVFVYDPTVDHMGRPLGLNGTLEHPRVHFKKVGIGAKDETRKGLVYRTLKTLMRDNGGHKWIDILKIDVEGHEAPGLIQFLEDWKNEDGLPFGQLAMELHPGMMAWNNPRGKWNRTKVVAFLQLLEARGLRMYEMERLPQNLYWVGEMAFINVKKFHKIPGFENYTNMA